MDKLAGGGMVETYIQTAQGNWANYNQLFINNQVKEPTKDQENKENFEALELDSDIEDML